MSSYVLAFKPAIDLYGQHDPSAALFEDGRLVYGIEEERLTRQKHAVDTFPERAIRACLDHRDLALSDVDRVLLPYDPSLQSKLLPHYVRDAVRVDGPVRTLASVENLVKTQVKSRYFPTREIESRLAALGDSVPPIETRAHHACHAASAFHPSGFEDALVLTVDAKGEYDSTVVWQGDSGGLERVRTYEHPNSLGLFFAVVTEYLGYRMFNGEGKVMGLAPYGSANPDIESTLRSLIDPGVDYDVTELTRRWGTGHGVRRLEAAFGRDRVETPEAFSQWEKDLAYTAQKLLEETVLDIVEEYAGTVGSSNLALAGGVALNCKLNKRLRESETVDDIFIQPVAHDAGLALGAGWLDQPPADVPRLDTVYYGPEYDTDAIRDRLDTNKIPYHEPEDTERVVAERLADGDLVGWFDGRLELGPRALGNRSILADPRTTESRDRVNQFVKHREEWRPFAPSILEAAADDYLVDGEPAPFMISAFDVDPDRREEIEAVLHPADDTTRPQTVNERQNPRYHRLISEFADITGVPVLLNTSFNDHAEPIVTTPTEAVKDFFGMGLDVLVLEDLVVEKSAAKTARQAAPVGSV
ncbi:carbamoyltransferase [Halorientalis sp. IM1011]|uniref:carbamoyltransferase family protein n=1 Tax=Halorientalis sp. IM1011 TaxID=1932360 RepID=UPI00097CD35A|nr:carbamoyltransferase C-terminal domain-containing protein [Halorientalis sp. IM1011]AQL42882.1 carbamoyltransferase [Halorientalis sp. IM1011]